MQVFNGTLSVCARLIVSFGVLGGALSVQSASAAAEAPGKEGGDAVLEEVLVTARRTSENLQDVPIAVTALSADDLVQQNIVRTTDLMYVVPSLTVAPLFNVFLNTYSLRGLPTGVTTYFAESACCIGSASMPFLDIQSVQALNGPQGTLFGRTSAAGSILLEPVRPDLEETDAYVKLRLGDYDRLEVTGTANIPVIPGTLAVRIAVNSTKVDGYTSQMGSGNNLDEQKNQQARLGIQFEHERFRNYTAISYIHVDQSATNEVLVGANTDLFPYNLDPAFAPFVYGPPCVGAVSIGLNADVDSCVAERVNIVADISNSLQEELERVRNGGDSAIRRTPAAINDQPTFLELKDWSILNVAEFGDMDLGFAQVSVKDVASYEWVTNNTGNPSDGIGGKAQQAGAFNTAGVGANNTRNGKVVARLGPYTEILNNDLNLNFDINDGLVEAVVGFYYTRSESPKSRKGTGNIYQLWSGVLNPGLEYQSAVNFNDDTYSSQRAWYTQATLDASDLGVNGLKITAGYRKSWDKSSVSGFPPVFDLQSGTYSPGTTLSKSSSESNGYNYLFTIAQEVTSDFMVYLTNSRAYVPGGVNTTSTVGGVENLPNYSPTYDPEVVTAWELGGKVDFYLTDNTPVRLNAAIYYYEFDDIVVGFTGFTGTASIGYFANAAAAELQGVELSGAIQLFDDLTISFAYNYNDAEYTEWTATDPLNVAQPGDPNCLPQSTAQNCLIDLTGEKFVRMPEHQGHVTVAYHLPLDPSFGDLSLSATVYAQGEVWYDASSQRQLQVLPNAKPALSQSGYSLLNLRADWHNVVDSGFDAAVFVSNASDRVYKLGATPQLLTLGYANATYAPPRMAGIEISKRF